MLKIQLISGSGDIIKESFGEERVYLGYKGALGDGASVKIITYNPRSESVV